MHRIHCHRCSARNRLSADSSAAVLLLPLLLLLTVACSAQSILSQPALPAGLPDVLARSNGSKITTPAQWQAHRAQLLKLFTEQEYGVAPPRPKNMRFVVVDDTRNALSGTATRKQVTILLDGTSSGPKLHLLLYIPNRVHRPPGFYGPQFLGK